MPPQRRPLNYSPLPVDPEEVRKGLALAGTTCEYDRDYCTTQAVAVHLGARSVAYLCRSHADAVATDKRLAVLLEQDIWDWFQDMFNVFNINDNMGGTYLEKIKQVQYEDRAVRRAATISTKKLKRDVIRAMNEDVKIGAPDDGLAQARGVQSPSRDVVQPVIRNPDPVPDLIPAQLFI